MAIIRFGWKVSRILSAEVWHSLCTWTGALVAVARWLQLRGGCICDREGEYLVVGDIDPLRHFAGSAGENAEHGV
jgi:hypothetical protein